MECSGTPGGLTMQRITREQAKKYAFDWRDEPLLRVRPGESFEIETYDASTGYFKTPEDKAIPAQAARASTARRRRPTPSAGRSTSKEPSAATWSSSRIEDIVVDDYSWVAIGPRRGPLGESTRWPELSADYTTKIFRHTPGPSGTTRDGTLHFNDKISLADHAVRRHARRLPGSRGGDQHRRPGGVGRQPRHPRRDRRQPHLPDRVSPRRALLPGRRSRQPGRHRVHRHRRRDEGHRSRSSGADEEEAHPVAADREAESIVSVYADKPLEVAVETATVNLMDWLITEYGFTPTDAYCLVSTCPDFRINVYQMCKLAKLSFVAGAEIPKRYLNG